MKKLIPKIQLIMGGSSLGLSTFATPKIDTLGLPRLAHLASPKSTLGLPKLTH